MPDEDDGLLEELGELANEAILVKTLMGWDGDRCECPACACERFPFGTNGTMCAECIARDHWRADG